MLVYVSAPYSEVSDKDSLMRTIAAFSGRYMLANPGEYAVSGLMHHYAIKEEPALGTDYKFWKEWCDLCMAVCTKMVVLTVPGWSTSEGVAAEIEYAKKVNMPIAYIDPYSYNNFA